MYAKIMKCHEQVKIYTNLSDEFLHLCYQVTFDK